MGSSQVTADRLEAADRVEVGISSTICNECEGACHGLAVWARGTMGEESYRTCLFAREHLSLAQLLTALGRWCMGHGTLIQQRENARWVLEHQGTLW